MQFMPSQARSVGRGVGLVLGRGTFPDFPANSSATLLVRDVHVHLDCPGSHKTVFLVLAHGHRPGTEDFGGVLVGSSLRGPCPMS